MSEQLLSSLPPETLELAGIKILANFANAPAYIEFLSEMVPRRESGPNEYSPDDLAALNFDDPLMQAHNTALAGIMQAHGMRRLFPHYEKSPPLNSQVDRWHRDTIPGILLSTNVPTQYAIKPESPAFYRHRTRYPSESASEPSCLPRIAESEILTADPYILVRQEGGVLHRRNPQALESERNLLIGRQ